MWPIAVHYHNCVDEDTKPRDTCTWVHLFVSDNLLRTIHIILVPKEGADTPDKPSVQTFESPDLYPEDPTAITINIPGINASGFTARNQEALVQQRLEFLRSARVRATSVDINFREELGEPSRLGPSEALESVESPGSSFWGHLNFPEPAQNRDSTTQKLALPQLVKQEAASPVHFPHSSMNWASD